ncbi:MAG: hypothetical protein P8130_13095 [Deltaproteobacteria bacterium]
MKKSKKKEIQDAAQTNYMKMLRNLRNIQDAAQTNYMKMLRNLRNRITSEYSKVIKKEYQGIILGYD